MDTTLLNINVEWVTVINTYVKFEFNDLPLQRYENDLEWRWFISIYP